MTVPVLTFNDRAKAGELRIDLRTLVGTRALVQGGSGAGKSRLARWILEQTHGKLPHWIIDPEHEFYTLREKFDYLLVGKGGDLPAVTEHVDVLAKHLAELHASAIFDLSEMSLREQREYVRAFFTALIALPDELRQHALVPLDEAHVFAPEDGKSLASEAVVDLGRRGRKRGICLMAITTRISSLDKDVAASLNNVFIGYTGLDTDIDRAAKRLGFRNKEQREQLPQLEPGEFFVHGPALSKMAVLARSPAKVQTTHPEPGELRPPSPPAPEKVRAMVTQLGELAVEAEEEARTKEDLARQVDEWRRKARDLELRVDELERTPSIDEGALQRARDEARQDEWQRHARVRDVIQARAAGLASEAGQIAGTLGELGNAVDLLLGGVRGTAEAATQLQDECTAIAVHLGEDFPLEAPDPAAVVREQPQRPRAATPIAPSPARPASERPVPRAVTRDKGDAKDGALPPVQQELLDALALLESAKISPVPYEILAYVAKRSPTSSSTEIAMRRLRDRDLVTASTGDVALTPYGRRAARQPDRVPTLREFHDRLRSVFDEKERAMLDVVIGRNRRPVSIEELARETGQSPTSSSFEIRERRLRKMGLIVQPDRGIIGAGPRLYPEGLR
jgi:uncharacterized protein